MQPREKAALIALMRASPLTHKQVLAQLGLAKSTYYDWCRRHGDRPEGLRDQPAGPKAPWNKLRPQEEQAILALASPELSPRELALQITDAGAFSVSEPTCYRILKRNGLVKAATWSPSSTTTAASSLRRCAPQGRLWPGACSPT